MRVVCLVVVAACYSPNLHGGSPCGPNEPCPDPLVCSAATQTCEPTNMPGGDGGMDGNSDGARAIDGPGTACLGPDSGRVCMTPPPTSAVTLSGTISTDTSNLCSKTASWASVSSGEPDACFVVGTTVTISGTTNATGSRPLVIVATDSITVNAVLDVSSHSGNGGSGPASDSSSCKSFVAAPQNNVAGAGGGAGASFMTTGGNGGTGDMGAAGRGVAPSQDALPPSALRGGCRGQAGGIGSGVAASGGHGGGVVYLLAVNTISLQAAIDASGAGGGGAAGTDGGGAGGGSGGMIALDASTFIGGTAAKLVANGGGGGAGTDGLSGQPGSDPSPTSPFMQAAGGTDLDADDAGGGEGFAGSNNATAGGNAIDGGGGGGGGAAGYIVANQMIANAQASPSIVVVP